MGMGSLLPRRSVLSATVLAAATGVGASFASAAVYTDATGENHDGFAHMDISSVTVTNTATDITFAITLSGSPTGGNNWGKYLVGISTSAATGDPNTPVGNPWGRDIALADKNDAWIGGWADGGTGFQTFTYSGSWSGPASGTPVIGGNTYSVTTSLSSLGLSLGQTIRFDVYTSGGGAGDGANDSAATAGQASPDWGTPFVTSSESALSYTIEAVPEPASLGMLAIGGIAMLRRRMGQ